MNYDYDQWIQKILKIQNGEEKCSFWLDLGLIDKSGNCQWLECTYVSITDLLIKAKSMIESNDDLVSFDVGLCG